MNLSHSDDSMDRLRALSTDELVRLGEESLVQRLTEQAVHAHLKYHPLTLQKLEALLSDPDCARHPTRLVFEFGEMAMHQFAQPELDPRNPDADGRVLYLRPALRDRPDDVIAAAAYMLPLLNYGEEVITDEHCLLYGATLLGMMKEDFYRKVCELADLAGCETLWAGPPEGSGDKLTCAPQNPPGAQPGPAPR